MLLGYKIHVIDWMGTTQIKLQWYISLRNLYNKWLQFIGDIHNYTLYMGTIFHVSPASGVLLKTENSLQWHQDCLHCWWVKNLLVGVIPHVCNCALCCCHHAETETVLIQCHSNHTRNLPFEEVFFLFFLLFFLSLFSCLFYEGRHWRVGTWD